MAKPWGGKAEWWHWALYAGLVWWFVTSSKASAQQQPTPSPVPQLPTPQPLPLPLPKPAPQPTTQGRAEDADRWLTEITQDYYDQQGPVVVDVGEELRRVA